MGSTGLSEHGSQSHNLRIITEKDLLRLIKKKDLQIHPSDDRRKRNEGHTNETGGL